MSQRKYTYDHARPTLTADIILLSRDAEPRVLLIRRKHEPFAGAWALPGGFVNEEESMEAAARRELFEETGLQVDKLEQLQTFGDRGRDPRGWTVSVAFVARVEAAQMRPRAADDAAEVGWHSLNQLPSLAFDHEKILARARQWLARTSDIPV